MYKISPNKPILSNNMITNISEFRVHVIRMIRVLAVTDKKVQAKTVLEMTCRPA